MANHMLISIHTSGSKASKIGGIIDITLRILKLTELISLHIWTKMHFLCYENLSEHTFGVSKCRVSCWLPRSSLHTVSD